MFTVKLGSATAIVLTDRRFVENLLDKKSSIYSERPSSYLSQDLIARGDHLLVMNHDDAWKSFRKTVHRHFMESMYEREHVNLQNAEAVQMMRDFVIASDQHMVHSQRFSNSIIMSIRELAHLAQLARYLYEGLIDFHSIRYMDFIFRYFTSSPFVRHHGQVVQTYGIWGNATSRHLSLS